MGAFGDLDFSRRAARAEAARARRSWGWAVALAVGLLLLLALMFRQPLLDRLWPESRVRQLHQQAAQALQAGHLSASDGGGARQLYEAAIAIDPDQIESRTGLARVALAALVKAREAVQAGQFEQAHANLTLARELNAPQAQVNLVADELREREAGAVGGVEALLTRARQAAEQDNLDGDEGAALPLYRQILSLQPDHVQALEGREDALSELLQRARRAMRGNDLVAASRLVASVRRYDGGHYDLPAIQAELTRALDHERQQAERELRRGFLRQAAEHYVRLRDARPDDPAGRQGVAAVVDAWAERAERAAGNSDFAEAQAALKQALALVPEPTPALAQAQQRVAEAQRVHGRIQAAQPQQQADPERLGQLLVEARAAMGRGDLVAPPGDSAFDKLRAARALAPRDPAVQDASALLLARAHQCFERELSGNNLGRARECMDAGLALEGETPENRDAARRLAARWLAVGEERLGSGDLAGARTALVSARGIDPTAAGLDGFQQRVQAASTRAAE